MAGKSQSYVDKKRGRVANDAKTQIACLLVWTALVTPLAAAPKLPACFLTWLQVVDLGG